MKKVLLFASAIALMTSCAKTELGTAVDGDTPVKGISFTSAIEGADEGTKSEWAKNEEGKWIMNWYAEKDAVSVFYKNAKVMKADGTLITDAASTWSATATEYKATRTGLGGYFVGKSDYLDFAENTDEAKNKASFYVAWPNTVTAATPVDKVLTVLLPTTAAQTQTDLDGASTVKNVFMVTAPKALNDVVKPVKNGSASDALINMTLTRPFPLAYFKVKNYISDYGALKLIKLTTKGSVVSATDNTVVDAASKISYDGTSTYDLESGKTVFNNETSSITLTISATTWSDDATAFMAINNVDRSEFEKAETYTIEYAFANTTITKEYTTENSWKVEGTTNVVVMPELDLAAEKWVLLGTASPKTLILNEGFEGTAMSSIETKLETLTDITKLVANSNVTKADFGWMGAKLTNVADVTLRVNTEIPAFDVVAGAVKLTSVIAPQVSKIDPMAFNKTGGALELTTCILPSYDFANVNVAESLLKKGNLKVADLSGVATFSNKFPKEGLSLQGFTNLTNLTVKNGVAVGTKAFDGCTALQSINFPEGTVDGSIILTAGPGYAFNGCSGLVAISVSSTEIPDGTFNGCSILKDITSDGKTAIAPTKIGAQAFQSTAIVDMNLSKAATIGKEAFKSCTSLEGTPDEVKGINVLSVDAITVVEEGVFSGCTKLEYIGFAKANKVNTNFLDGTSCTEISFDQVITGADKMDAKSFGIVNDIASGTTLFVNGGQVVNGSTLTLGSTGKTENFTFKAIK